MKDIISDLKEQVKIKGSRDDIMRLAELIAFEEREEWKERMKPLVQAVKDVKRSQKGKIDNLGIRRLCVALESARSVTPEMAFLTQKKYRAKEQTSTRIFQGKIKT
jgi:translation elongation factor EF-Tu-like GTPase